MLTTIQIHALVARGSTILAEHQAGKRDFSQGKCFEVTECIIAKATTSNTNNPVKDSSEQQVRCSLLGPMFQT
jgi:hypothetical protein